MTNGQTRSDDMIEREHTMSAEDGHRIVYREWLPQGGILAVVLIVHGLGEHSGRYRHVADALTTVGFACFGIDHRGHGKSEGLRAYLPDIRLAVHDLAQLYDTVNANYPDKPVLLFGHSMGSLIGLEFALRYPERLRAIALSGTAINAENSRPNWLVSLCLFAARHIPRVRLSPPTSPSVLSHDQAVLRELWADPLTDKGMWRIGTSAALVQSARRIRQTAHQLRVPLLALHGSDDSLVPASGATFLEQHVASRDITIKIYDGLRHELVNEIGREQIIATLVEWMLDRV